MIGEEYRSNITHYMLNGTLCVHCCRRNRLRLDLVILCLRLHPSQNNMTCLWSVILRKMPECQQTAREIRMEMDSPESLQKVCMLLCQSENSHSQVTFTIIKRDFKGRDILGTVILCLDCYLTYCTSTNINIIDFWIYCGAKQYLLVQFQCLKPHLCKLSLKLGSIHIWKTVHMVFTAVFIIQSACKS